MKQSKECTQNIPFPSFHYKNKKAIPQCEMTFAPLLGSRTSSGSYGLIPNAFGGGLIKDPKSFHYKNKKAIPQCEMTFAPLLGLEPKTYGLTVRRSNQLS